MKTNLGSIRERWTLAVVPTALVLAASANPASAQCVSPPSEVLAGRVLRSITFGQTHDLLLQLSVSGVNGYVLGQLDPAGIDESSNTKLQDALAGIHVPTSQGDPQATIGMLANYTTAQALFANRQLLERLTAFWDNHFSTSIFDVLAKVSNNEGVAVWLEHYENEQFRAKALGTFYELLKASAQSPAMLYYLDNVSNTAAGVNENYSRELMELHVLGVDNGYNSEDVAEVAECFTGWTVAKKLPADFGNPAAAPISCAYEWETYFMGDLDDDGCIDSEDLDFIVAASMGPYNFRYDIWPGPSNFCTATGYPSPDYGDGVIDSNDIGVVSGNQGTCRWSYSFHFDADPTVHQYGFKQIFEEPGGLPTLNIPAYPLPIGGGGNPAAVNEGLMVLQHLAGSTQCAGFISTKLYNLFVSDQDLATFDPALLTTLRNKWAASNGSIYGILRSMFANTLVQPTYDMDFDKARTGFEKAVAAVRALNGTAPGGAASSWQSVDALREWMDQRLNYPLFRHPSPDGFAEDGGKVIDTGTMLAWFQLNQHLWDTSSPHQPPLPDFDYDLDGLMLAAGLNLDDPDEVTCFILRLLVQDNFTTNDFALVKTFLTTTPGGGPFTLDYTNNLAGWLRAVHKATAFALCLPQFIEQ